MRDRTLRQGFWALAAALVLTTLLDVLTTLVGIYHYGLTEGNELPQQALSAYGPAGLAAGALLTTGVFLFCLWGLLVYVPGEEYDLWRERQVEYLALGLLTFGVVAKATAVLWNVSLMV